MLTAGPDYYGSPVQYYILCISIINMYVYFVYIITNEMQGVRSCLLYTSDAADE